MKNIFKHETPIIEKETVYVFYSEEKSYKRGKTEGLRKGVFIGEVMICGAYCMGRLVRYLIDKRA